MGQWVNTHLSPARFGYQFLDDYQETNGSASLNISSSFTFEIAITPKEGQTYYALALKGDITKNPLQNLQGHTLFVWSTGGYANFKIFGTESGTGYGFQFKTQSPVFNSIDVVDFVITFDMFTEQVLCYVNGVNEGIDIISVGTGGFQTSGYITDMNSGVFPAVFNNATSKIYIGKALGYEQFEGIIHDLGYHAKVKSATEVTARYNLLKNPSPPTLGNIIFTSTRLTAPARERIYKMNEKGANQNLFFSQVFSVSNPRVNKSNNPLLDKTKICTFGVGNNGLIIMNIDGSLPVNSLSGTNAQDPFLSFDLTKVCYSFSSSGNPQIYIADFNPTTNAISNPTQVTTYSGNVNFRHLAPSFSPDGTKIIFRRIDVTGNEFLMRIDTDGNNMITLLSGNDQEDLLYQYYSKDGTKIGFSKREYMGSGFTWKSQVYTMDGSGGNLKQITSEGFDNYFGDFSPDGLNIVYRQAFTSGDILYRCDINGRNKVNISGSFYNGYADYHGSWY